MLRYGEYSPFIVANILVLFFASCVATLFPICHLAFALALSSSVTVVGDRAVFSGIMQIVTSAVRVFFCTCGYKVGAVPSLAALEHQLRFTGCEEGGDPRELSRALRHALGRHAFTSDTKVSAAHDNSAGVAVCSDPENRHQSDACAWEEALRL